jgi:hypothetical protein
LELDTRMHLEREKPVTHARGRESWPRPAGEAGRKSRCGLAGDVVFFKKKFFLKKNVGDALRVFLLNS